MPSGGVEGAVGRENQGRARRQDDPSVDVDALGDELVHLPHQPGGVDHHPRPEIALGPGVDDPRGHQVEGEVAVGVADGVAGVVAAVVADDGGETAGEQIHDLALALVAPLTTDDHERILTHAASGARSYRERPHEPSLRGMRPPAIPVPHGSQEVVRR